MTGCHHRRDHVSFRDGAFHVAPADDLDPAWLDFVGAPDDDAVERPDDSDRLNVDIGAVIALGIIAWAIVECVRAVAGTG